MQRRKVAHFTFDARVDPQFTPFRTSSTGPMPWFSRGHGSAAQQDRRTTLRVRSERGERVAVAVFEGLPRP